MLQAVLVALLAFSCAYWLTAFLFLYFFLHKRVAPSGQFLPPVSLLKPIRGVDARAYQNFQLLPTGLSLL
jgi:hypothetical protein